MVRKISSAPMRREHKITFPNFNGFIHISTCQYFSVIIFRYLICAFSFLFFSDFLHFLNKTRIAVKLWNKVSLQNICVLSFLINNQSIFISALQWRKTDIDHTKVLFCSDDNFASLLLKELIKELQTGLFNLWKVKQEMFAETNFSSSRALTKQTFFTRASFDAGAQWGWLWVKKS